MQANTTRRDWQPILERAAAIVRSYDTGVTLRQLFYRLVSEELIRNTQSEYAQLSHRTAAARREGTFPALFDRTRGIVEATAFDGPDDAKQWLRSIYRRDRSEGQQHLVYLGIEKGGIVEQLRAWFSDPLGIPILPLQGYHSEAFERRIAERHAIDGRETVLLYAGDLDASGEDIERNFLRHVPFDSSTKVALTASQAVEYDLPPLPGKATDQRAKGFAEKYGSLFQIEVDALPPDTLRDLFAAAIAEYWDDGAYQAALERETAEREEL